MKLFDIFLKVVVLAYMFMGFVCAGGVIYYAVTAIEPANIMVFLILFIISTVCAEVIEAYRTSLLK